MLCLINRRPGGGGSSSQKGSLRAGVHRLGSLNRRWSCLSLSSRTEATGAETPLARIEPEREKELPKQELEDRDNEVEVTTGYDLRVLATEADSESHFNSDAAAMSTHEHVNDCIRGGDENGEVDRKKPARRKVVSSMDRIVESFGLRAPTMLTIKSLLQKLVRTGLEWIRPPQDELGKEPATAVRQEMKLEPHDYPEMLCSLPPCKRLKQEKRHTNLSVGDICLINQDGAAYGTYTLCQVLRNEISTTDQVRKVKVDFGEKEFVVGVQRLMLLMTTDEVKLLRMPTEGDIELPGECCPGLPADTAEQDAGATDVEPRRSLRLREKANLVKYA